MGYSKKCAVFGFICLAVFSIGAAAQGKKQDKWIDNVPLPALTLKAKVPAATIVISEKTPCAIEEAAQGHPNAIGGKYIKLNGDYLFVCAWIVGEKVHVYDQVGKLRVVPIESFEPVH